MGLRKHTPANIQEYRNTAKNGYFETVNGIKKQSNFLKYKNKTIGTYILYEDLEDSLNQIMKEIGVEVKYPLPRHKSDARPKTSNFLFEEEDIKKIKLYFKEDFEVYNKLRAEKNGSRD